MQKMIYRRHINTPTWHFCTTCRGWPNDTFDETADLANCGELCAVCQAALLRGTCEQLRDAVTK